MPFRLQYPGDIINFSVTGTIILTTGQLFIPNNLTINGPGVNLLTIDGNANSRIFDIGPGAVVTITDMTVTNGNVSQRMAARSGTWER